MATINLKLSPAEQNAYIPEWCDATPQDLDGLPPSILVKGDGENQHQITLGAESYLQWRKDGIKVVGCVLGLDNFCQNTIKNTANKIKRDLECLDVFQLVHQRFELATH